LMATMNQNSFMNEASTIRKATYPINLPIIIPPRK
jgi:hypothetical protein